MHRISRALAVFLITLLAACGGGGSGGSGSSGTTKTSTAASTSAAPVTPISIPEASRLLTQTTFGPTDADIASVQSSGISGWIRGQISAPQASSMVSYVDGRLAQLRQTTPTATLSANQFYEAFWQQAVNAPDQLRQRVRFALSQIFVISLVDSTVGQDVRGVASYYDMLEANAFGNFRTLLEAVTLHPMMGIYMTYLANQKESADGTRTPDQNYAREVEQLMTIGLYMLNNDGTQKLDASGQPIPTYTQNDILGLAKVFTGISWYSPTPTNTTFTGGNRDPNADNTPMIFYPSFHSTSQKQFLGVTIPASTTADVAGDLKIALDTLFNHPNVGPFIAQRLIQQLVTSNPTPAYVGRVAAVFNNNSSGVRGDMAATITAVLTDSEARDMTAVGSQTFGKLREPIIRMTNWMRAFGATSASGNWLMTSTSANTSLSQSAETAASVFNFWRPGYVPPNTLLGAANLYAPEFQAVDEVSTAGYLNTLQNTINTGIGTGNDIQAPYTTETGISDPNALIDRVNNLLLYGQMSAGLRQRISDAVNSVAVTGTPAQIATANLNRVKLAIFLTMASPEYLAQR